MKKIAFYLIFVSFCMVSCLNAGALFEHSYPSVDECFASSMNYYHQQGEQYPEMEVKTDGYKVYVFSDSHVAYYNSVLTAFRDTFMADIDAPVAICLGDLVEANQSYFWFCQPFEYQSEPRNKFDTLFVALGNHDLFYNQYDYFIERFKTTIYRFTIRTKDGSRDMFICLDTAHGSLGRRQLDWLRNQLMYAKETGYRNIFVYTHVNLVRSDNTHADASTVALEESFELMSLFSQYGVRQFWAGHDHARDGFMQGGVQYILLESMREADEHPGYMVLHVSPSSINNTFHVISCERNVDPRDM